MQQGKSDFLCQGLESEVVQDDECLSFQVIKQFDVRTIEFGEGYFFNEPVHVQVSGLVALQAGLVAECAGQVTFTTAGGAGEQDIFTVLQVTSRFLELQGPDLNEGIVIREFIPLNDLTIHSKSGMPLKQEYRLFCFQGHLLGCYNYWEEGSYNIEDSIPVSQFEQLAKRVQSNFFSMDIAKTKTGEWIVIELGDGQVAGIPDTVGRMDFYSQLKSFAFESKRIKRVYAANHYQIYKVTPLLPPRHFQRHH